MLKLLAIACIALLPITYGPTITMAQYHQNLGATAVKDQPYQLVRQQQQQQSPGSLYQGPGISEAVSNYAHHQQHNKFLNQQKVNQPSVLLSSNDQRAPIPINSILGNLSPNSPSITALNKANYLRQHHQQQQLNIPIIPAPGAPHLTLNKFISHSNNNNNNNNNQVNNQQANLFLQNQFSTLNNDNVNGYIPLNSYQQQQQTPAINFASPSVNNRPNVSPNHNNNLLQHLPMSPPRASPSQQQQQQQVLNDDQRIWNSNRLPPIQNIGNNQQVNSTPQASDQRQLYQVNNFQQTGASTSTPSISSIQQQYHINFSNESFTTTTIRPDKINKNSVMKGLDDSMMPSEKKSTMVEQVTNVSKSNNITLFASDEKSKRNNSPVSKASDTVGANTTTANEGELFKEGESNSNNRPSRPTNTVLESSMHSLETSTSSLATTPSIDQSSLPATSKLILTPSVITATSPSPIMSSKQSDIVGTDWYPLDETNSRFGRKNSTSIVTEGVTLQPAPDILTVSPNHNMNPRNQSSYEIVVSQQMGAPGIINQVDFNETVAKGKTDQNKAVDQTDSNETPSKSTTLIQPTATTTIIWSSGSWPTAIPRQSLLPTTTVRNDVSSTQNSKADNMPNRADDAPVVYGKSLSQARPFAPPSSGHNLSSSPGGSILAPSLVTGQANIETSVPAMGKPFIVPVEMDAVRPYASVSQHSGQSRTSANSHHGIRSSMGASSSKSGGGPVMQIGSGLTVTALNNETTTSNQKQPQPARNLLGGSQHTDFMHQGLNLNLVRSAIGAQSQPAISSSFQVSNSAPNEEKSSGDGISDMDSFDLNIDSSNNEPFHTSHITSTNNATSPTSSHTIVRRPPFRPRPVILTRIDTCIVGDDKSCDQSHNERCILEFGISSCHCRPGFARTSHLRGPCVFSNSFGLTLKVDKLTDRKLVFNSTLNDVNSTEYQYLEYESLQAIGTAFQQTKFASFFMGAKVNKFFAIGGKIFINMTVNLESNNQTQSQQIKRATQHELLRVAESRHRNLGDSNLWLDSTPNAISRLEDINECADRDLNDCSEFATCSNDFGTFQCQCLPGYEDQNAGDRGKSGRQCFGCSPSYCSNRGDCHIVDGQKQCKCRANFIGSRCDIDGEVMAVAVGGSLTALIIFIITFWCLYVYNQRWKHEQQKIDAMSATSGLTFSYVNSSTNNLMSAFSHHQQASDQQAMITSGSSSGGGPSARSMNFGSSSSSYQTSPSNQSFAGGIVGIATSVGQNGVYDGHTMRGANGGYTISGHHHHGYGGGTTKSNYVAQLHHHNGSANNYRTLTCGNGLGTLYSMGQEVSGQPMARHDKSRMGNCYYLSPEMLVSQQQQQQQQHHHLYSSPQQRMLSNHSPTSYINGNQYIADDRELCIDTSGATVSIGGLAKRGGVPRNQSYHHQNLIFNQQHGGNHNQGRQGASLKSKSRSSKALNVPDRIGYNQMAADGGIYNETEFLSRDVYMPQYLMSE